MRTIFRLVAVLFIIGGFLSGFYMAVLIGLVLLWVAQ